MRCECLALTPYGVSVYARVSMHVRARVSMHVRAFRVCVPGRRGEPRHKLRHVKHRLRARTHSHTHTHTQNSQEREQYQARLSEKENMARAQQTKNNQLVASHEQQMNYLYTLYMDLCDRIDNYHQGLEQECAQFEVK